MGECKAGTRFPLQRGRKLHGDGFNLDVQLRKPEETKLHLEPSAGHLQRPHLAALTPQLLVSPPQTLNTRFFCSVSLQLHLLQLPAAAAAVAAAAAQQAENLETKGSENVAAG